MANVDQLVLGSVNASLRRVIDAPTLVAALADPVLARQWGTHLDAFFEDVPREALLRFVRLHCIDPARLLDTYRRLSSTEHECDEELDRWLTELAGLA